MSNTMKAIERHMTLPVRLGPPAKAGSSQPRGADLVAEWQQRGPETLSGHIVRKLRLVLVPTQSALIASATR